MSSNTKIIVLKSKELIYTGIFIVFGALLILLLYHMFSSDDKKDEKPAATEESSETMATFTPGVYSSNVNIGGANLEIIVTVDENNITQADIKNLDDTVTAMYPLLEPSLDEINSQLTTVSSLDDITYSGSNKYTSILLLGAIKQALSPATAGQ